MVADAEGIPSFGDTHTNEQNGQAYSGFLLNFRDTMLVISGCSAKVRAKIASALSRAGRPVTDENIVALYRRAQGIN
jgi:hypothetical protein